MLDPIPDPHPMEVKIRELRLSNPKAFRILAIISLHNLVNPSHWDNIWEKQYTQLKEIIKLLEKPD